jgi:hypothetical protein
MRTDRHDEANSRLCETLRTRLKINFAYLWFHMTKKLTNFLATRHLSEHLQDSHLLKTLRLPISHEM